MSKRSSKIVPVFVAGSLLGLLTGTGWASALYSTGPVYFGNGGAAYRISGGFEATDSFVISSDSMVTGASKIGLVVDGEETPEDLSWVISTSPDGGGTVKGSGLGAGLSSSFVEDLNGDPNQELYYSNFSISGLSLSAGTYYLELLNADTQNSERVSWMAVTPGTGTGPSIADNGYGPIATESFEIDGAIATAATPEPSGASLSIITLAVLSLTGLLKARKARS